jgi:hypothetical protein
MIHQKHFSPTWSTYRFEQTYNKDHQNNHTTGSPYEALGYHIQTSNSTKLSAYMLERDYTRAISEIKRSPEKARNRITAHRFLGSPRDSHVLPLHLALSAADVPMQLIAALLKAYPGAIHQLESGTKRNCLHIALKSNVEESIISYLYQEYPELIKQQDELGRLPIHYALSNLHKESTIHDLLKAYPEAAKSWDKAGWSPLHVAVQTNTSSKIIQELIKINPDAVVMQTNKGRTPLDIALGNSTTKGYEEYLQGRYDAYQKLPFIQNYRLAEKRRNHNIPSLYSYVV